MIKILRVEKRKVRSRGGRKEKISFPNQLLLCLEYLREYRTFFHISPSYSVSETTAWRIQKWAEETLIHSGEFTLPGKKFYKIPILKLKRCWLMSVSAQSSTLRKKVKNRKSIQKHYNFWKKEEAHSKVTDNCEHKL